MKKLICNSCKNEIAKNDSSYSVISKDGKTVLNFCSYNCMCKYFDEYHIKIKEQEKLRNDQIKDNNTEQYAWNNPVMSREDVGKLFNEIFEGGAVKERIFDKCCSFDNEIRKLANENAEKILFNKKFQKEIDRKVLESLQSNKDNLKTGLGKEWQICPKCKGTGEESIPLEILKCLTPEDLEVYYEDNNFKCELCHGKKIISILTGHPPLKRADKVIIYRNYVADYSAYLYKCPECGSNKIRNQDMYCAFCGTQIEWK